LQRCSLACNELSSIDFKHKGLAISLSTLKSLSVSFSDRIIFYSKQNVERSDDPAEEMDWRHLMKKEALMIVGQRRKLMATLLDLRSFYSSAAN
jgi:hypothetical protein